MQVSPAEFALCQRHQSYECQINLLGHNILYWRVDWRYTSNSSNSMVRSSIVWAQQAGAAKAARRVAELSRHTIKGQYKWHGSKLLQSSACAARGNAEPRNRAWVCSACDMTNMETQTRDRTAAPREYTSVRSMILPSSSLRKAI